LTLRRPYEFAAGAFRFCLGEETKLMAVLNVTPDSFSDGGKFFDPARAELAALRMQDEGAHILDIGGESSRPGAPSVPWKEELARIRPVLKRLAPKLKIPISVDTCKAEVAQAALDEGASIINDITGLRANKKLGRLVARSGGAIVLMHMQGSPRTMQKDPRYKDVVREVKASLKRSASLAREAGVPRRSIVLDPGFGFGKTAEHNFSLLSSLDEFASLGYPVLVGLSRKSFLGNPLGLAAGERLHVSVSAAVAAIGRGAHILRVHDVRAHAEAAAVADKLLSKGRIA
jgi:dihydropteroate synthase